MLTFLYVLYSDIMHSDILFTTCLEFIRQDGDNYRYALVFTLPITFLKYILTDIIVCKISYHLWLLNEIQTFILIFICRNNQNFNWSNYVWLLPVTNQSTNYPSNKPTYQSTKTQSTNKPIYQPPNQATNQSSDQQRNLEIIQPIYKPPNHPINQSINLTKLNQPTNLSIT